MSKNENADQNNSNDATDECNENEEVINNCATLDMLQYADYQNYTDDIQYDYNTKVKDYVASMKENGALNADNKEVYQIAVEACNDESSDIGEFTILAQSGPILNDNGELVIATAYESPNGDMYVTYRGTGDGKWPDNGDGLTSEGSMMQKTSVDFFDEVMEKYGDDLSGNLYVSGHSKGANEAQYVALFSEYGYKITKVYSIDGQGMSEKAIAKAKELRGEDYYYGQLDKMYAINGDNDYVDPLGKVIISDDHTIYVPTSSEGKEGVFSDTSNIMMEYHALHYIMDRETCSGIAWAKDEDGNIIDVGRGDFGKLIVELNKRLMDLDEEVLDDCAITTMSILELLMNDKEGDKKYVGTGDRKFVNIEEFSGFVVHGIPTILATLVETEEGRELCLETFKDVSESIKEKVKEGYDLYVDTYGSVLGTVMYALFIVVALSILLTIAKIAYKLIEGIVLLSIIIDLVTTLEDKLRKIEEWIGNIVISFVKDLVNWLTYVVVSVDVGCQYAVSNPYIKIDTDKMYTCATRLRNLNTLITTIDTDMDSLYWELASSSVEEAKSGNVGTAITDLSGYWNLIVADVMTIYSLRLWACASYLENTAERFENVENELATI